MKNRKLLIGLLAGSVVLSALPFLASAAPLYFPPTRQSAQATSTLSYMTPGTATTTVAYDSYTAGDNFKTDAASLLVQSTASSTNTKYVINFEYSQDGIDWYTDSQSNFQLGTTTGSTNVNLANSVYWNFASSTLDGVASSNVPENKLINVATPLRFVRAVVTLGLGGTNGAIWVQWVPAKQIQGN